MDLAVGRGEGLTLGQSICLGGGGPFGHPRVSTPSLTLWADEKPPKHSGGFAGVEDPPGALCGEQPRGLLGLLEQGCWETVAEAEAVGT